MCNFWEVPYLECVYGKERSGMLEPQCLVYCGRHVEDTYASTAITNSHMIGICREFDKFDTCAKTLIIFACSRGVWPRPGFEEMAIRGVEEDLVALARRLPKYQPFPIRAPHQSLCINSIWEPGSLYFPSRRLVDADNVFAPCSGEDG